MRRLTCLLGILHAGREVQGLTGQVDLFSGRKLPWNQNLELSCSHVVPDLVSKSAGLRLPGHQNQFLGVETAAISMSLVP